MVGGSVGWWVGGFNQTRQTPPLLQREGWWAWNLLCSFNLNKINVATQVGEIGKALDTYSRKSTVNGLFMLNLTKQRWKHFAISISLNKEPTCFKNVDNPSCTDLFLINKCVEDCLTLEADLLDFHNFIVNVEKVKHERLPPKAIKYRDYKHFVTKVFEKRHQRTLNKTGSYD